MKNQKEKRSGRLYLRIKPSVKKKLMEMAKEQRKSIADLIEEWVKNKKANPSIE